MFIPYFQSDRRYKKHCLLIGDGIASQLSVVNNKIDFTLPDQRLDKHCFTEHDLAIFAMPVYAGRIPNKILPFVQSLFSGENTPVVLISVFGNRSFDEALMELKIELEKRNFKAIAAQLSPTCVLLSKLLKTDRPTGFTRNSTVHFRYN